MPIYPDAVLARLNAAHEHFLDGYVRWGGYQFHGWTAEADQRNYHGPVVWSEADCVLRFALELEREFPEQVHCEVKINKSSRLDFPSDAEKAQQVDIAVSDLGAFEAGDGAYDAFRSHRHALFVEVKWFQKGWRGGQWEFDGLDHVRRVEADLMKLDRHLRLGRCQVAAMLVVDDEGLFEEHGADLAWPAGVHRLMASPTEVDRRAQSAKPQHSHT
ncbi:MAG: hypothetical protein ACLQBY_16875 [Solirubrobacteraceae bacterium]